MSEQAATTRTYRGTSLDELLPRIRDELGEDAVITRQREGIVGGIGGFFGKRVLEVEATAAAFVEDLLQPSLPAGQVAAAYLGSFDDEILAEMAENPLVSSLIEQSTPFAAHLSALLEADDRPAFRAEEPASPGVRFLEVDEQVAVEALEAGLGAPLPGLPDDPAFVPEPGAEDGLELRELGALDLLEAGGFGRPLALSLVRETLLHGAALDRRAPFTGQLRRTIARRIPVRYSFPTPGHRAVLAGLPEGGKTSVAARLARGYSAAGLRVAILALEDERPAERLRRLVRGTGVEVVAASTAAVASAAATRLSEANDLVLVDTPSVSARAVAEVAELARLVGAVAPDTVHLVAPAPFPHASGALVAALEPILPVDRLVLTHVDATSAPGALVALAIERELPVSYVSSGDGDGTLAPADPVDLARLVLR